MRYFEIEGKECRALPMEEDLLLKGAGGEAIGDPGTEVLDSNCQKNAVSSENKKEDIGVFIRNIPKNMKQSELHQIFEKHGEIQRLMLSFDLNHKSKGYGFVYYRSKESA